MVIENKRASASFLQRKLKIGYAQAAQLIDMLEQEGVISPADRVKSKRSVKK